MQASATLWSLCAFFAAIVSIVASSSAQRQPQGNLYLVPFGQVLAVSMGDLATYYRTALGLEVSVLSALPLERDAYDARRQQYIAERLIETMKRRAAGPAKDPAAVLIGVTEEDMYIAGSTWRYALSLRADGRFAVVSAARMKWPSGEIVPDRDLVRSRVRKMVSKNIGMLVYRLRASVDPSSILYQGVMSPSDLDAMTESFETFGASASIGPPVIHPPMPVGTFPCFVVLDAQAPPLGTAPSTRITQCSPDFRTDEQLDQLEIDLRTGGLISRKTDVFVADVIPLGVVRSYRLWDTQQRSFGIATDHAYEMFPVGSRQPYTWMELIFGDGSRLHYDRISPGTGFADARYEHRATDTRFRNSRIEWNGNGWDLKLSDGTLFRFPAGHAAKRSAEAGLIELRDPAGRAVRFDRDERKNLVKLTSPTGRVVVFEYDPDNRIVAIGAEDGRRTRYEYGGAGRLDLVTDPEGRMTRYLYDENKLIGVRGADGRLLFRIRYVGDRVAELHFADGPVHRFEYTFDRSSDRYAALALVTAPDGSVTELAMTDGTLVTTRRIR